tara:strand:- start:488 stop:715 length:228 start_codon:yes stop_codon:yes gene_type:complete
MKHKMSPHLVHVFKQAGRDELKKAMEEKKAVQEEMLSILKGGDSDPVAIGIVQGVLMGFAAVDEIIEKLNAKKPA